MTTLPGELPFAYSVPLRGKADTGPREKWFLDTLRFEVPVFDRADAPIAASWVELPREDRWPARNWRIHVVDGRLFVPIAMYSDPRTVDPEAVRPGILHRPLRDQFFAADILLEMMGFSGDRPAVRGWLVGDRLVPARWPPDGSDVPSWHLARAQLEKVVASLAVIGGEVVQAVPNMELRTDLRHYAPGTRATRRIVVKKTTMARNSSVSSGCYPQDLAVFPLGDDGVLDRLSADIGDGEPVRSFRDLAVFDPTAFEIDARLTMVRRFVAAVVSDMTADVGDLPGDVAATFVALRTLDFETRAARHDLDAALVYLAAVGDRLAGTALGQRIAAGLRFHDHAFPNPRPNRVAAARTP